MLALFKPCLLLICLQLASADIYDYEEDYTPNSDINLKEFVPYGDAEMENCWIEGVLTKETSHLNGTLIKCFPHGWNCTLYAPNILIIGYKNVICRDYSKKKTVEYECDYRWFDRRKFCRSEHSDCYRTLMACYDKNRKTTTMKPSTTTKKTTTTQTTTSTAMITTTTMPVTEQTTTLLAVPVSVNKTLTGTLLNDVNVTKDVASTTIPTTNSTGSKTVKVQDAPFPKIQHPFLRLFVITLTVLLIAMIFICCGFFAGMYYHAHCCGYGDITEEIPEQPRPIDPFFRNTRTEEEIRLQEF